MLQPDPGEGVRRGQSNVELLQFARGGGNDRNLGDQRLVQAGLHLQLAEAERHCAGAGQPERHGQGKTQVPVIHVTLSRKLSLARADAAIEDAIPC